MKLRMKCIEVTVNDDLTVMFRLTLQIKESYLHLFTDSSRIKSYISNNKIRYMYVFESSERAEVLQTMVAAQAIINEFKIKELQGKQEFLLERLSKPSTITL